MRSPVRPLVPSLNKQFIPSQQRRSRPFAPPDAPRDPRVPAVLRDPEPDTPPVNHRMSIILTGARRGQSAAGTAEGAGRERWRARGGGGRR